MEPRINTRNGLTDQEDKVMNALVTAYNEFTRLPKNSESDCREFADGIHKCQALIAVRIVRRDYPNGWTPRA